MPPPPLLQHPYQQRQLVAVLMGVLLLASLGAAYVFGGARLTRLEVALQTVQVGRLAMDVPETWSRDAEAEAAMGVAGARVYRNPDRSHHVLRLLPFTLPRAVPPALIVESTRQALLSEEELQTFQALGAQQLPPSQALQVAEMAGVSQLGPQPTDVRVHLIAAMTVDGHTHWVLHMTDRPTAEEAPAWVLQQNMRLFRQIERSAAVQPGAQEGDGDGEG